MHNHIDNHTRQIKEPLKEGFVARVGVKRTVPSHAHSELTVRRSADGVSVRHHRQ